MASILNILIDGLDWDIKNQVNRRYEAMKNEFEYLKETKNENLFLSLKYSWNDKRYDALFCLNAFYQVVLGPITSSTAPQSNYNIGIQNPITYGKSMRLDKKWNHNVTNMDADFFKIVRKFQFGEFLITANRVSDITYQIAKVIKEQSFDE